jgi:ethanolamine utilization protein EutM
VPPSENAIGLIETRGIVALTAGIEAMMKTADVRCVAVERVSSGYFAAAVQGSIASVRQALDSGTAAVKQYGDLRSRSSTRARTAPPPALLDNGTREALNSPNGHKALSKGRAT